MDQTQPTPEDDRRLSVAIERFRLTIAAGPGEGTTFVSRGAKVVVGTHERCDFVVQDPTVSKFHCEISVDGRDVTVRDLGSRNGTLVQGVPIETAHLLPGFLLGLGATYLRFSLDDAQVEVVASGRERWGGLVGGSMAMRHTYRLLERAAASDVTVLLTGETGTGKDLAAQAIHDESARRAGPFLIVDLGAVHSAQLEAELFGHEGGVAGCFEAAKGGTIYLDEIAELRPDLQPRLLRVLEKGEVRRVGGSLPIPVDARVIAATSRDLRAEVNQKRFRADLYYRLAVLAVRMPTLAERLDDLPLLVERFLELRGATPAELALVRSEEFVTRARAHEWPGNVRELRSWVDRTLALAGEPAPDEPFRAPEATSAPNLALPLAQARDIAVREFEARYLAAMLARHGNVAAAAKAAGVDRTHFHRLVRKLRSP